MDLVNIHDLPDARTKVTVFNNILKNSENEEQSILKLKHLLIDDSRFLRRRHNDLDECINIIRSGYMDKDIITMIDLFGDKYPVFNIDEEEIELICTKLEYMSKWLTHFASEISAVKF